VKSFFSGKHASNNRGILKELLLSESLNRHTLSKRLGVDYTTIHDRIRELSEQGIVEEKGQRPGEKNKKQSTVLWGIAALGLWLAVHAVPMTSREDSKSSRERKERETTTIRTKALDECKARISQYWRAFTDIYELDSVETEGDAYREFTKWLESGKGTLEFLDTFGAWPLAGRAAALGTFRRMIDLSLLRRHGAWFEILPAFGVRHVQTDWFLDPDNPYQALGEIATRHEKFQKLDGILREVDAPIDAYLNRAAYEELIQKLEVPLGETMAKKLAAIPFFKKRKASGIGVSSEILTLLSPNAFFDLGTTISVEPERVIIGTDDPQSINPEWKDYCDVEVYDTRGKIKTILAKKTPEPSQLSPREPLASNLADNSSDKET